MKFYGTAYIAGQNDWKVVITIIVISAEQAVRLTKEVVG
jgi:hypothetical protein